jgi:hypothetical protein
MDKFVTFLEDLNFFELHISRNDKQIYFIEYSKPNFETFYPQEEKIGSYWGI